MFKDKVDAKTAEPSGDNKEQVRMIIVKRTPMTFNDAQSSVISFTDITAYKRL